MAISDIRSNKIVTTIIQSYLEQGQVPTIKQIEEEFDAFVESNNLNLPTFRSPEFEMEFQENSSAQKYNRGNRTVKDDLTVLYRALYQTTGRSVELFNRWESKVSKLENKILDLEGRIGRLLALAQDTEGFFDIVGDSFSNTSLIDLDLSRNLEINLGQNLIMMSKVSNGLGETTRISLNDLAPSQATFNLFEQDGIVSVTNVNNTHPRYAFFDIDRFWKTHVFATKRVSPLVGELTLSLSEPITISKIDILLHTSESNSLTKITPLYSIDGVNFNRLPSVNPTLEAIDKMEFVFPEIRASRIKFIVEKNGHDAITGDNLFLYEFGAKEISVYKEAFSSNPNLRGLFISKHLSAKQRDGSVTLFNKLTLEVCESTSSATAIDYFLAVAKNNEGVPVWLTETGFVESPGHIVSGRDTRLWTAISPLNRELITHPQVLDFSNLIKLEREDIKISYQKDGGIIHESPARQFTLATIGPGNTVVFKDAETLVGERRYLFARSNHRILDVQIDQNLNLDLNNLVLWRNVGKIGIAPDDTSKHVRGVQMGWEFKEPFYKTNILISQTEGLTIDVGDHPISIDQVNYTGVIGPDILSQGIHSIKIHKDFWRAIPPGLNSEQAIRQVDILYPYNQKLLIEGYGYGASFPEESKRVYVGASRFAGIICDRVGLFDIINNVPESDFSKFAIDTDTPGTSEIVSEGQAPLSHVIVLNTNNSIADFMNEKFVLEFNLTDELFSFVALRAELRTSNNQVSPIFDEYQIKLAV
jgi:hypothetical protein